MGRQQRASVHPSAGAIPLFHDGPHQQMDYRIDETGNCSTTTLMSTLLRAPTRQAQLQALQLHKSTLLQQPHNEQYTLEISYKILLEWAISVDTPTSIQRAVTSNLQTMQRIMSADQTRIIQQNVLDSLCRDGRQVWKNSCYSLLQLLNVLPRWYEDSESTSSIREYLRQQAIGYAAILEHADNTSQTIIEQAVQIAVLAKTVESATTITGTVDTELIRFLWLLLSCPLVAPDALSIVGIAYGRAISQRECPFDWSSFDQLAEGARIALWQGLAATLDTSQMQQVYENDKGTTVQKYLFVSLQQAALMASDPDVRLAAIKGIRTLLRRAAEDWMIQEAMDLVWKVWENPPTRKIASAVPPLFQQLVQFQLNNTKELVDIIMRQPLHRKGRYLALEILLPLIGASSFVKILPELVNGIGDPGHNTGAMADLWERLITQYAKEFTNSNTWVQSWLPSLATGLLSPEISRRKQVASFCLPRLRFDDKVRTSNSFSHLLVEIRNIGKEKTTEFEIPSKERETLTDRILWAELEIIRFCEGVLQHKASAELVNVIAESMPMDRVQLALTHFLPTIRISAFLTMSPVLESTMSASTCFEIRQREMHFWKFALPFACKDISKEQMAQLLHCLLSFLDRFSIEESKQLNENTGPLSMIHEFVVEFLLQELVVKMLAYPGSVPDKENFAFHLLEAILSYAARDLCCAYESKVLPKTDAIYRRKRSIREEATVEVIRQSLVCHDVISGLFNMLHSSWDNIRSSGYEMLNVILEMALSYGIAFPDAFHSPRSRKSLEMRGLYLASSPRQREADTGARILAYLVLSADTNVDKLAMVRKFTNVLEDIIDAMRNKLALVLSTSSDIAEADELPLAHGLIQSLRLISDADIPGKWKSEDAQIMPDVCNKMLLLLCRATKLSLAIVADVKEGYTVDGLDEEEVLSGKINPGAIGANGIFSSVKRLSNLEQRRRLAAQRVVVGSWLLTKETSHAMASILIANDCEADAAIVDEIGTLLISTLTSLKHTGAAFAAHRALHTIATKCFSSKELEHFPTIWAGRLIHEITSQEKIRDSTLRRSTGYAVGMLSLMRAEVKARSSPRSLCPQMLSELLLLSLPTYGEVEAFLGKIGENEMTPSGLFSFLKKEDSLRFVPLENYQTRSRVHALNVLRHVILDAPLAQETVPMIGDAFTVATLGYFDAEWSVRNSSTMVFSACMLRSIDADKNASNNDKTSSRAISISELFRLYPTLPRVFLAIMKASLEGTLHFGISDSLPPIFLILLLFSRVQPVGQSESDALGHVEPFIGVFFECLAHRHISIRKIAARALVNISSRERYFKCSISSMMKVCLETFTVAGSLAPVFSAWNKLDGHLLLAREFLKDDTVISEFNNECLEVFQRLQPLVWSKSKGFRIPPLSTSIAVQIMSRIDARLDDGGHFDHYLAALIETIRTKQVAENNIAGYAELRVMIGRIYSDRISKKLWDSIETERFRTHCDSLSEILRCTNTDIRLAAVKEVKRSLYQGIDKLLSHRDNELVTSHILILTQCFSRVLQHEIDRTRDPVTFKLGAHPPTLRRLSRCLLECLNVCTTSQVSVAVPNLMDLANDLADGALSEHNEETEAIALLGNAVEVSSYIESVSQADYEMFLARITKLSDPSLSWRVRHSVATVMKRVVLRDRIEDTAEISVHLLQDGDVDVRFASVSALAPLVDPSTSMVPELLLKHLFKNGRFMRSWCGEKVMSYILDYSKNLEQYLDDLIWEIRYTQTSSSEQTLLNTDGRRKIFEADDPNTYHEPALVVQLAIESLLNSNNSSVDWTPVYQRVQKVLSIISQVGDRSPDEWINDPTNHRSIFAPLHSLLLGAAYARVLGRVPSMVGPVPKIHPQLMSLLLIITGNIEHKDKAIGIIRQSCFLVQQDFFG